MELGHSACARGSYRDHCSRIFPPEKAPGHHIWHWLALYCASSGHAVYPPGGGVKRTEPVSAFVWVYSDCWLSVVACLPQGQGGGRGGAGSGYRALRYPNGLSQRRLEVRYRFLVERS